MVASLIIAVNGEKHDIKDPDPTLSLSDYLRAAGKTGVKIGCGEGGCGACTVALAEWSEKDGRALFRSVNACLVPLCSCDGLAITTTEGLRNHCDGGKGFHPLQETLAAKNGSQCGFCSPGMVMSMFGVLSRAQGPQCPGPVEIEGAIDGNLCRCTGYRAILDAFKEFSGKPKDSVAGERFAPFPDFLKARAPAPCPGPFTGSGKTWLAPASVPELLAAVEAAAAERPEAVVSMVAGHTCRGIYKEDHAIDVLVDITKVPELRAVDREEGGIRFGSAVTLTTFIETLLETESSVPGKPELEALPVLVQHARRISGHGIRNWGTIGGNVVMTKVKGFQSDLATILTGIGAKATVLRSKAEEEEVELDRFFAVDFDFPKHALLKSIFVPFLEPGEIFRSFKTAVRPQNSHALVNAAFRVKMEAGVVTTARLVFGAFGSRGDSPGPSDPETGKGGAPGGPLRALATEKALTGSTLQDDVLQKAIEALQSEHWFPEDEFERHLCLGFLYKLARALKGTSADEPFLSVAQTSLRPATTSNQKIEWCTPEEAPIGKALPKLNAVLQAAGDVRYTNDVPEPKDCLYAAYVQVPRAKVVLVSVDVEEALAMPGVFGFVGPEDIPGENITDGLLPGVVQVKLLLPKGEASQYAGQPCLVVLADSTRHAEAAAKRVALTLDASSGGPAVLSSEAYIKSVRKDQYCPPSRQSGEEPSPFSVDLPDKPAHALSRGDADKALAEAPHKVSGEIFCNSQKHFYMEPQAAIVIPGEDGTLTTWQSVQVPSWTHEALRRVTALPKNKLLVNVPSLGGGFGGKIFRGMHVGAVACIAVMKTKRAVRFHLNRNVDTVMTGGRISMNINYEAGFDAAGKLLAVKVRNFADGGNLDPCSGFVHEVADKNMEEIYGIPNMDCKVFAVKTDKTPCTAVRGPGEPQAAFIMESIMEHVAEELGKSAHDVREANIFTDLAAREKCAADPTSKDIERYSAQLAVGGGKDAGGAEFLDYPALGIWEMLKKNADYAGKAKAVEEFNSTHKWRKRGVSMTPVKYGVSIRSQQALVLFYDDGTVLITVDGSEIGQGLHTKVIQYASYYLSQVLPGVEVPVDKIRVGHTATDKIAQGSITGGSTTSEGCCEAVREAIGKLVETLQPAKEKLEAKGEPLTFAGLVKAASDVSAGLEMQASGRCGKAGLHYHVFGACVSEVEIDVLTGETTILSSSMLYDCGKSLNPLIDCGQAEGAFLMGVGFYLRENLLQNTETGQVISDGTWEYKIPCAQDVPLEFNVEFFPRAFSEAGIKSSKASGEPPLVLATSVFCALRQAIAAGRREFGRTGHFRLDAPATPRDIALLVGAGPKHMSLQ